MAKFKYYDGTNWVELLPTTGGTLTGLLSIAPTNIAGNYDEGIRLHPYSNWSTIMFCASDNSGNTGTSANSWSIHNNEGTFGVYKNGSNISSATAGFTNSNGSWTFKGRTDIVITSSDTALNLHSSTGNAYLGFYNGNGNALGWLGVNGSNQPIFNVSGADHVLAYVSDIPTNNNQLTNGAGYITSASIPSSLPANGGNADTVDNEHASAFAHICVGNNLITAGNEFNFIADNYGGENGADVWINYTTPSRNNSAKITGYILGTGHGTQLGVVLHSGNIGSYLASQSSNGFMSSTDKTALDGIVASLNNDDSDSVVNRLKDVLSVFQDYPEGTTVLSALNSKVNLTNGSVQTITNTAAGGTVLKLKTTNDSDCGIMYENQSGNGGFIGVNNNSKPFFYDTSSHVLAFASDIPNVPSWALQSSKPSYNYSEIGAGNITMGDGSTWFRYRTTTSLEAGFYYHTSGDESVVFANEYSGAGWMFVNGTKPTDLTNWQSLTPTLQIKRGGVAIGKLIGQGATPTYNLDVNGTANATTLYENGTQLSSKYLQLSGDTMSGTLYFTQLQGEGSSNRIIARHLDGQNCSGDYDLYLQYHESSSKIWLNGTTYYIQGGYYNGTSASANSVAWSNVSGKPTIATTNDAGLVYFGDMEQNNNQSYLSGTVAPQGHTHSQYITSSGSCASATSAGSATVADNVSYIDARSNTSNLPSRANTSGQLKFVLCASESSTKYDGYVYLILS